VLNRPARLLSVKAWTSSTSLYLAYLNPRIKSRNNVLLAKEEEAGEHKYTMHFWLEHITGRGDWKYAFWPSETSYERMMLEMINVCFDEERYDGVVREVTKNACMKRMMDFDNGFESDNSDW
jgi:hypothetical protein